MVAGSQQASCTAETPPQPSTPAMRRVVRLSWMIARDAIISETTTQALLLGEAAERQVGGRQGRRRVNALVVFGGLVGAVRWSYASSCALKNA